MSTGPGGGSEFEGGGLSQTVSMTSLRSGASDASLQRAASESNGGGEEETSPSGSRASTPSRARRRRRRRRMAAKATSTLTKTMLIVSIIVSLCIMLTLYLSLPCFLSLPPPSPTQGETGRLASELCSSSQGRKEVVESYIKKVSGKPIFFWLVLV